LETMNFRCLHPDTSTVHSVLRACNITGERAVARTLIASTRRLAADLRGVSRFSSVRARASEHVTLT